MTNANSVLRCGACLGAMAAIAPAQEMTFFWEITDDGNQDGMVCDDECALLTLYAQMEPGAVGFAAAAYDIIGDARWADGVIKNNGNILDSLTHDGDVQPDNDITGIESAHLPPFFNPNFDASNPVAIYSIAWQPNDYTSGVAVVDTVVHQAYVYLDDFGSSQEYTPISISGEIVICPAPGS